MYLYKQHHTKNYGVQSPRHAVSVATDATPRTDIKPERITYVLEEVAYWRKANQVHGWFVRNVQEDTDNGASYFVSREQLERLRDTAKTVLNDNCLAESLLPVCEGFFFGTYDYDNYYFSDLADTVAQLDAVLAEPDTGADFKYRASW